MERGYSILLGENIPASAISYADCAPLQIVCPACKEPVFKAARIRNAESVHYLSHYREDKAYQAECDLRVRTTNLAELHGQNTISRDQRLEYFLKRFVDLLKQDPLVSYSVSFDRTHREIARSESLRNIRKWLYEHIVETGISAEPNSIALDSDLYIKEMEAFGEVPKTDFSTVVQKRIALDLFCTLHTQHQRSNQAYLFEHALICLYTKFHNSVDDAGAKHDVFNKHFLVCLGGLLSGEEARASSAISELLKLEVHPPYVEITTHGMNFLSIECIYEMLGTLLRLPYFNLIKEYLSIKRK